MTRDEAVVQVQQILGFHTGLASQIQTGLIHAQDYFERGPIDPWFLRSEREFIQTQADEERLPIPNNFLAEVDDSHLWLVPSDSSEDEVELLKDELDYLRVTYGRSGGTGTPKAYALDNIYYRLFPTPDGIHTIKAIHIHQDTRLSTNVENAWLKHSPWLLIGRAGKIIAGAAGNARAKADFVELEAGALASLTSKQTSREMDNRRLQMGGPI